MVSLAENPPAPSPRLGIRPIRLGYVPLVDSAPLLVAERENFFAKRGLEVRLSREPGWASIREKLIYGEIDAAQCPGGLVIAMNYGIQCLPKRIFVPLILNANGNAITLSTSIPPAALKGADALQSFLKTRPHERPLTLATAHPFSSHHALLQQWLLQHGLPKSGNVNIIFLPPPVVSRTLAAGAIDGFCVGEPWNSHSILAGHGRCEATSVDLANGHPEKVFAVSEALVSDRRDEVIALTAALHDACALCDDPTYRPHLVSLLQNTGRLGTSAESIQNSLGTTFRSDRTKPGRHIPGLHLFSGKGVKRPSMEHVNWIVNGMRQTGLIQSPHLDGLADILRADLYDAAMALKRSGDIPVAG